METEDNLEPIHTEQMQDIIGTPPIWLYRWGISLVLGITLLCILISSFIPYPEVVKTHLKMVTSATVQIVSVRDSAQLDAIFVQNEKKVYKDQLLALAECATGEIKIKAKNNGELRYVGIVREKEQLVPGQAIFNIVSNTGDFYGEMPIPKYMAGKVRPGQTVLAKIKSLSTDGYVSLQGKIKYIADNSLKNDEFIAEVNFPPNIYKNDKDNYMLMNGTTVEAEIVTIPSTIFHRIMQSLLKGLKIK